MQDFFIYDNGEGCLRLNECSILLVKEFDALWDINRNKCKEDKTGKERKLAWKEFTYIWLMCDYKSPYQQYLEQDRHLAAMGDSGLTEDEWKDSLFRAAIRKYLEIKESSRFLGLIKTSYRTLEKLRVFLDNVDFEERDANDKPIFRGKDVMGDIASLGSMYEKLRELEVAYKKDETAIVSKNRGDAEEGYDDK